ncbi:MAG: helix-turn-helix transcriptional regulator [Deltaproteobacteria bacterium]|nr:helix-turn-helix transcriptional regulator [Deltaproteobacteria bacterium]
MTTPSELDRHLGRSDALIGEIERYELELDLLLSMRRIDPELPDNFFRTDSIVPPPPAQPPAPPADPDQIARDIGLRIRLTREDSGWTQQDLADRTGIRRPNIARLERGASLPNLATLIKITGGLEISLADLISTSR